MAQEIAAERNVTPHEVLLDLVRTGTRRAAWVNGVIVHSGGPAAKTASRRCSPLRFEPGRDRAAGPRRVRRMRVTPPG